MVLAPGRPVEYRPAAVFSEYGPYEVPALGVLQAELGEYTAYRVASDDTVNLVYANHLKQRAVLVLDHHFRTVGLAVVQFLGEMANKGKAVLVLAIPEN